MPQLGGAANDLLRRRGGRRPEGAQASCLATQADALAVGPSFISPDPAEAQGNTGSDPETTIKHAAWRANETMSSQ